MAARAVSEEHVVEEEPNPELPLKERPPGRDWYKKLLRLYEVPNVLKQVIARLDPFEHLLEVEQLKVAQSSVSHLRAAARCCASEIGAIYQCNRESACSREPRQHRAMNSTADDSQVKRLTAAEPFEL